MSRLRVVELADVATAYAGRLLVGLGHEVLRVITPTGDPLREVDAQGLAYLHLAAGKSGVRLDPADGADRDVFLGLVDRADVLLDDGSLEGTWKVDAGDLGRHLVHVGLTGFGSDGPQAGWRATDLVACAAGGMMSLSGHPDGPPLAPPREQAHHLGGLNAAIGTLLAVRARRRLGRGQHVDVSLQESVAASLEYGALLYLHEDRVHRRTGDVYPHVPHRIYEAADGWLAGGFGGSPRMWTELLAWMLEEGAAGDLTDERWQDERTRFAEREHVSAVVEGFTRTHPRAFFFHEAQRRQLPWAIVATPEELLDNEHLHARRFFAEVETATGRLRDVGITPAAPPNGSPARLSVREPDTRPPPWSEPAEGTASARARPAARNAAGALDGIRVLDLTWVLAGPYATMVLADHGAEVIKIESRHRPDPTRFASNLHLSREAELHPDRSGYFNNYNRNKRSVTLNLRHPEAVEVLRRLVPHCDVVVENFSAGTLGRWGLDHPNLRRLREDIILVSMAGMGQSGPWSGYVSYADALAALSALTAQTAAPGGRPAGITFGLADIVAALHAVLATLVALERRDATGEGCHVDLAQLEAIASQVGTAVLEVQRGGSGYVEPNRHPTMAPHGAFPCRGEDRWIAIAVGSDGEFAAACEVLEASGLATDPRFATASDRKAHEDELDLEVAARTRAREAWELAAALQRAGVPAAAVADGRDLVERDEQLRARGFYVPLDHPVAGTVVHEGVPIHLDRTPGGVTRPAPLLGEHTGQVVADLARLDAADYQRLLDAGALE